MAKKILNPPNKRLLHWTDEERNLYFPQLSSLYHSEEVKPGKNIYPLTDEDKLNVFHSDTAGLASYQQSFGIAGLLVVRRGKIAYEWYKEGMKKESLWPLFSVVKSITSLLVGVANKEGAINTLEDGLIYYLPELKGSVYELVTIRQLLTMQTGVPWLEDTRNPHSTIATQYRLEGHNYKKEIIRYIKTLSHSPRSNKSWNYNTNETDLLGLILQEAMGMRLATMLSQYVWEPFSMEKSAYWAVDQENGYNLGGSGLSTTLRDYARLGQFVLQDCYLAGESIVSEEWADKSRQTVVELLDNPYNYGYLWWINKRNKQNKSCYMALGMYGQCLFIDPVREMVIAQIANYRDTRSPQYINAHQRMLQFFEENLL